MTRVKGMQIQDPPVAQFLFGDTRMSIVWLALRLWLGWQWLTSGWGKVGNPDWLQTGVALQKFWEKAVIVPEQGKPAVAYDWYRGFLQALLEGGHYTWFAKLVVFAEVAIGIALIVGAFTAFAAFGGALMNWNFVMAGTASVNALLFVAAVLIILAWKTAGYYGLDRIILPALGTPWQPGRVVGGETKRRTPRMTAGQAA